MRSRIPLFMLIVLVVVALAACSKKQQSQEQNQPGSNAATASSATPSPAPQENAAPTGAPAARPSNPRPEMARKPEPPPPITVPAGTSLTVRVGSAISTKTAQAGQSFSGALVKAVSVDDKVAIPEGSTVQGTVTESKSPGKFKGAGVLALKLNSLTVYGVPYDISTSSYVQTEKGKGKRSAIAIGGGAGAGALIGGLIGHGKGAGIGAIAGAGAGTAGAALTGNKDLEIPAEAAVTFQLSEPISVKQAGPSAAQ